jgi:C4-dicarboxylate-specific signal transduction histidine kinase
MIAMHTFGAGPYTSAMSSMLRALFAARGWILGIQILVLISCLNGFVQTGDAFSALTCLAAVALFSLFAGLISSAVYGLAASLCFAMVLLAPLHHYMRLTAQTVLAMTAFLASAMALVMLVHRLRKLSTVPKDKKDDDALRDIRAHFVEEMRLTTFDELSASIAHEIAQPLSAIVLDGQACLRWARQDNPPSVEIQDCVKRMTSDGRRASDTVKRIRDRCRCSPLRLVRTTMNDIVREVAPLITREADAYGATLELRLSSPIADVMADPSRLQQVLLNLTQNALQAMNGIVDRPARLVISSFTTEAGAVVVSVTDNGPGIAGYDLNQIFEPFITTRHGALGLGLSICRSIIEAHGGQISATNNADHGANFVVSLPRACPVGTEGISLP